MAFGNPAFRYQKTRSGGACDHQLPADPLFRRHRRTGAGVASRRRVGDLAVGHHDRHQGTRAGRRHRPVPALPARHGTDRGRPAVPLPRLRHPQQGRGGDEPERGDQRPCRPAHGGSHLHRHRLLPALPHRALPEAVSQARAAVVRTHPRVDRGGAADQQIRHRGAAHLQHPEPGAHHRAAAQFHPAPVGARPPRAPVPGERGAGGDFPGSRISC